MNLEKIVFPNNYVFRFRNINNFTIKNLLLDEFNLTKASKFNDPFDSLPHYNETTIIDFLKKSSQNDKLSLYLLTAEYLSKLIQSNVLVASLSKVIDEPIMWAHYANNSRGFALAYDLNELFDLNYELLEITLEEKSSISLSNKSEVNKLEKYLNYTIPAISEVKYRNYAFDSTNNILKYLNAPDKKSDNIFLPDPKLRNAIEQMMKKSVFYKQKKWSYENEVRFCLFDQTADDYIFLTLAPHAIILGKDISTNDKDLLIEISKIKKMDIFQIESTNTTKKLNKFTIKRVSI